MLRSDNPAVQHVIDLVRAGRQEDATKYMIRSLLLGAAPVRIRAACDPSGFPLEMMTHQGECALCACVMPPTPWQHANDGDFWTRHMLEEHRLFWSVATKRYERLPAWAGRMNHVA
jgi:hypothetical protein